MHLDINMTAGGIYTNYAAALSALQAASNVKSKKDVPMKPHFRTSRRKLYELLSTFSFFVDALWVRVSHPHESNAMSTEGSNDCLTQSRSAVAFGNASSCHKLEPTAALKRFTSR